MTALWSSPHCGHNPSLWIIKIPQVHPGWLLLLSLLGEIISPWLSEKFCILLLQIASLTSDDSLTVMETCYRTLIANIFLVSSSSLLDSDLHFYSGCTDDDGCQANASWASTATVRAHWAHLRDLRRNLAFALHTLFQAQFAAFWLPSRNQRKYCSWGRIQLSVLSSSPLAGWVKRQLSTVHHFFNYSEVNIKAAAKVSWCFW